MPFSAGNFTLYSPGNPVVTGTSIASSWANNTLSDIATGLTTCITKNGQTTITANIPMSTFKFTGLGNGSATTDSVTYGQATQQPDNVFNVIGSSDATKKVAFEVDTNVPTATTVTLTVPGASGTVATSGDVFGKPVLNDYISGFTLTTASTTTYDIAAGYGANSDNTVMLSGGAITAKSQASWVAGSTQGGKLSAAAMANNTWYYWYALWKTADGTVDYGFDVATTPTLPSGYSKYRYIGAARTAAAATTWVTFIQHGDDFFYSTPPVIDVGGTAASTANRTLVTVATPALKVKWYGGINIDTPTASAFGMLLTDPACADIAPSPTTTPLTHVFNNTNAGGTLRSGTNANCWTNTSSQIGTRGTAANAYYLQTWGYMDPRGRPV